MSETIEQLKRQFIEASEELRKEKIGHQQTQSELADLKLRYLEEGRKEANKSSGDCELGRQQTSPTVSGPVCFKYD